MIDLIKENAQNQAWKAFCEVFLLHLFSFFFVFKSFFFFVCLLKRVLIRFSRLGLSFGMLKMYVCLLELGI